jgi:hypothetical protein
VKINKTSKGESFPESNSRILTETVIALSDVSKHLPSRPNQATVWRWQQKGVRGHKLATYRIGERIFTSVESVHRFLEAIQN